MLGLQITIQVDLLRLLTLADLHYDPLYLNNASTDADQCRKDAGALPAPAGRIGCDSPIGLIQKAIENSAQYGPYDLIFTMGDFPAHGLITKHSTYNDRNLSNQATKFVAQKIKQTYPNSMILGVIGNNEGDNNYNYTTIKNSERLRELYYDCNYKDMVNNNEKFLEYGYYVQETVHNITIIALNQNFYSPRDQPQVKDQIDPADQFKFLRAELKKANETQKQVIILYHGPFGVNGYNNQANTVDKFTQFYDDIVVKYQDIIICEYIGHYHQDQFRYRLDGRRAFGPGFLVPSISPSNGNNPGFRVTELRREHDKWVLNDYTQYYLDLNIANYNSSVSNDFKFKFQYKFSDFYALYVDNSKKAQPNVKNIQYLNDQMRIDDELYSRWIATSNLWYQPKMAENMCSIDALTQAEYQKCVKEYKYDK